MGIGKRKANIESFFFSFKLRTIDDQENFIV